MNLLHRVRFLRACAAVASGVAAAGLAQVLAFMDVLEPVARDLQGVTGFPLGEAPVLEWPWAGLLAMLVGAGAAWLALDLRKVWVSALLVATACVLCLTGAWVADLRGGTLPALPLVVTLLAAYGLGQLAAGFFGDAKTRAWEEALAGGLAPSSLRPAVAAARKESGLGNEDGAVVLVEAPDDDARFLAVVAHGLRREGAWVDTGEDGRLRVIFGLFDAPASEAAPAVLAKAAEALAVRGASGWRFALVQGACSAVLVTVRGLSRVVFRGQALPRAALLLEEFPPRPGAVVDWIVGSGYAGNPPDGWRADQGGGGVTRWLPAHTAPHQTDRAIGDDG